MDRTHPSVLSAIGEGAPRAGFTRSKPEPGLGSRDRFVLLIALTLVGGVWASVSLHLQTPLVLADEYVYLLRGDHIDRMAEIDRLQPGLPRVGNYLFLRLVDAVGALGAPLGLGMRLFNLACYLLALALVAQAALKLELGSRRYLLLAGLALIPLGSYAAYVMPESSYLLIFTVLALSISADVQLRPARTSLLAGLLLAMLTLLKPHGVFAFAAYFGAILTWGDLKTRAGRRQLIANCLLLVLAYGLATAVGLSLLRPAGLPDGADPIGGFYRTVVMAALLDIGRLGAAAAYFVTQLSALLVVMAPTAVFLSWLIVQDFRAPAGSGTRDSSTFAALFLLCLVVLVLAVVSYVLVGESTRLEMRYLNFTLPCMLVVAACAQRRASFTDGIGFRGCVALVWAGAAAAFLVRLPELRPLPVDAPELFFSYYSGEFGAFGFNRLTPWLVGMVVVVSVAVLLTRRARWLDVQLWALIAFMLAANANTIQWQLAWSERLRPLIALGDVARKLCPNGGEEFLVLGGGEGAAQVQTVLARLGRPVRIASGAENSTANLLARPASCILAPEGMAPLLGAPIKSAGGLSLFSGVTGSRILQDVRFDQGVRPPVLGQGWSMPEAGGIWSDGSVATLKLEVPRRPVGRLLLEVSALAHQPPGYDGQPVGVWIDGAQRGTWLVRDGVYAVELPGTRVGPLTVELRLPAAISPSALDASNADRRTLGIALRRLTIVHHPDMPRPET